MQRKLLLSALAATLIAAGGLALAQNAPAPTAPAPSAQSTPMPMRGAGRMQPMGARNGMHGGMHGGMHHRMGRHHGPAAAVIGNLHQIARLYIMDGKIRQLEGLYKDVLGKTQNPMVRNYVYRALARLQARPRDTGAAVATLRESLDENLKLLNAMPARGMGRGPGPKR